jgi:hypothetical protein
MRGGFASAWFGLNHAELVALDVGERRLLEVFVLDIPQTRGAESDEALDLGLTVRRVPVEMHSILRDLALGHLHEVEARSAGERGPLTEIAFGQFAAQRGRPEMADPLRVASVEYDREERESHFPEGTPLNVSRQRGCVHGEPVWAVNSRWDLRVPFRLSQHPDQHRPEGSGPPRSRSVVRPMTLGRWAVSFEV